MRFVFSILFILVICGSASAGYLYTPKKGSTERKSIMDTARIPIMKELAGQKIVFVVRKLNVFGNWAYLEAVPQLKNGKKVNYKITKFREDIRQGFFDDWVGVLLKRAGRGWKVEAYTIGATDYPVVAWPDEFGAPKDILQ